MRTDCTRDNRRCPLPTASLLGSGLGAAKRGHWVATRDFCGRVLGRVHADGKTYIEVVALMGAGDNPAVRWVDPADVLSCVPSPPRRIWKFMAGDWADPAAVMAAVAHGFLSDSYLDQKAADK